MDSKGQPNSFSLGAQIGGSVPAQVLKQEQQLRALMNGWIGRYSTAIREFAFLLRVDGDIHTYTKMWNIEGAQKAKRKRDWVEVEIGVPESWWKPNQGRDYKKLLATAVETGLHSMIELLQRNGRDIKSDALLEDWKKVKAEYLGAPENRESDEMGEQLRVVEQIMSRYSGALAVGETEETLLSQVLPPFALPSRRR